MRILIAAALALAFISQAAQAAVHATAKMDLAKLFIEYLDDPGRAQEYQVVEFGGSRTYQDVSHGASETTPTSAAPFDASLTSAEGLVTRSAASAAALRGRIDIPEYTSQDWIQRHAYAFSSARLVLGGDYVGRIRLNVPYRYEVRTSEPDEWARFSFYVGGDPYWDDLEFTLYEPGKIATGAGLASREFYLNGDGSLDLNLHQNILAVSYPVPEPETYALTGLGLAAVWLARRRGRVRIGAAHRRVSRRSATRQRPAASSSCRMRSVTSREIVASKVPTGSSAVRTGLITSPSNSSSQ